MLSQDCKIINSWSRDNGIKNIFASTAILAFRTLSVLYFNSVHYAFNTSCFLEFVSLYVIPQSLDFHEKCRHLLNLICFVTLQSCWESGLPTVISVSKETHSDASRLNSACNQWLEKKKRKVVQNGYHITSITLSHHQGLFPYCK